MQFRLIFFLALLVAWRSSGQGIHFSQFYNAPLLQNPANAGLMPDHDYRAGALYRNQWERIPIPFRTIAAFTDFKLLEDVQHDNWLGLGAAFFNDKAGLGDLALTRVQLGVAYHLKLGWSSMLSIGLETGLSQRSVDFSKLSFDMQWDGYRFNPQHHSGENYQFQKTSYVDLNAGINYSFFPNELFYWKIGLGMRHLNQPKESFYGMGNRIGIRPVANTDLIVQLSERFIADISAYYTMQKQASQVVFGGQIVSNITPKMEAPAALSIGVYHRFGDALIPVVGLEWTNINVMASFDITTSGLRRAAGGIGAFEMSIIYKGLYEGQRTRDRSGYNCPRF